MTTENTMIDINTMSLEEREALLKQLQAAKRQKLHTNTAEFVGVCNAIKEIAEKAGVKQQKVINEIKKHNGLTKQNAPRELTGRAKLAQEAKKLGIKIARTDKEPDIKRKIAAKKKK